MNAKNQTQSSSKMEEVSELRNWADLLPDALGLIFSNLSLQETLTVVPRVCKSWNQAVLGPYCWQNINIIDWSYRSNPDHIERMLRLLIARSGHALREISVSGIQNDLTFSFLADHARSLQTLQIQRCNISDSIVEQVAEKLSGVTFMDLSYCCKIGARALSAIGTSCKALVGLRRNMHPIDIKERHPQAEEAVAIATAMQNLKHLEMAYNCIDATSVVEILTSCTELELLDVRGCWDVKLDKEWLEKRAPRVKVLGPHVVDQFEGYDWESCSDYSDTDSFYDYESLDDGSWDDDDDADQLGGSFEVVFYDEFAGNYGNGWPPSP